MTAASTRIAEIEARALLYVEIAAALHGQGQRIRATQAMAKAQAAAGEAERMATCWATMQRSQQKSRRPQSRGAP